MDHVTPNPTQKRPKLDLRTQILEAALRVVETQGIAALTQPKVAVEAGLRQSHLTYYFPRRSDLFFELFEFIHSRKMDVDPSLPPPQACLRLLERLLFDRSQARFFFATALELCDEETLRSAFAEHVNGLAHYVGKSFQRAPDDLEVLMFIDLLRGASFRFLIDSAMQKPDLALLATRIGLQLPTSD